jgi:type I site-specific restriction endonuclease
LEHPEKVNVLRKYSDNQLWQKLLGKVNNGLSRIKSQLEAAAQATHEENKRNFDEQEQRISHLSEDMQKVVGQLSESLTEALSAYISTQQGVNDKQAVDGMCSLLYTCSYKQLDMLRRKGFH